MMANPCPLLTTESLSLDNQKRLRLSRIGRGPPLVFLHGYPDNLQIWARLATRLSSSFKCIALDWPGMGESEVW